MSENTDTTFESTDFEQESEPSFAQQLMKTSAVNAAATAGTLVALVAVGLTADKVRDFREKRKAKKAAEAVLTTESPAPQA